MSVCHKRALVKSSKKYKADITLGGLASAPGETDVFSQMTLRFTQGGPGMMDSGIYELSNSRR